ncbi:hypothetical protein KI387_034583, partial [Taxus chinensis]
MLKLVASLLLLIVGVLGENNNNEVDIVNLASFTWNDMDVEDKNCSAVQSGESSFALMHAQGKCSPFRLPNSTWFSTILEAIQGDANRYRAIMRRGNTEIVFNPQEDADVPLASGRAINAANYIIKLVFGTPGQSFYTVLDTGSDLTWIPCAPCSDCPSQVFEPSNSSTYNYLSCASRPCRDLGIRCTGNANSNCSFKETYGDGSQVDELLSSETVALGSQSQPVQDFVFGFDSSGFTGSLRLGRAALSAPGLQFTPLLSNAARPSFYYVGLNGISVGEERVSIPAETFEMDQSTGKGTIIDSGTIITRL